MAHFKCLRCRARVWHDAPRADHLDDLCPGCGDPLEAVGGLPELVGLRCLRARPKPTHRTPPDITARISEQIRETIERHDAERQYKIDRTGTGPGDGDARRAGRAHGPRPADAGM